VLLTGMEITGHSLMTFTAMIYQVPKFVEKIAVEHVLKHQDVLILLGLFIMVVPVE
jgi:hypothetical protein